MNAPRAPRFSRRPRFERRVRGRALERGAAMVEAVIVISMLMLGLTGLMFFRYFYVKELIAARLARASTLAYAMSGCDDGKRPKDWIGIKDRIDLTVSAPDADSQPATGTEVNKPATSSNSDANGFLSGLGLTGDGRGVLNPITKTGVSGKVKIESSSGASSSTKTYFKSDVMARSYVTCGEKPKDGDIGVLVKDLMGKLLGLAGL
jgi:hypothetical protein